MDGELEDENDSQDKDDMDLDEKGKQRTGEMDIDQSNNHGKFSEKSKLVKHIGKVVHDLRTLGFTSMTENAYASAIFSLLKVGIRFIMQQLFNEFRSFGQIFFSYFY